MLSSSLAAPQAVEDLMQDTTGTIMLYRRDFSRCSTSYHHIIPCPITPSNTLHPLTPPNNSITPYPLITLQSHHRSCRYDRRCGSRARLLPLCQRYDTCLLLVCIIACIIASFLHDSIAPHQHYHPTYRPTC